MIHLHVRDSAMMKSMRRYGWYVPLAPIVVFLADDIATNWHDRGHETTLRIAVEDLTEDLATLALVMVARWWRNHTIPHRHAECPECHFRFLMHPKQKIPFCPHRGAPELP